MLVTGAFGNVGREVLRALGRSNVDAVAADHQATRVSDAQRSGMRAVRLDFFDRATWEEAVEGATDLFLLRPPAISAVSKTLIPFVDFARARGVEHVVFLSVAGAGTNPLVPHRAVEKHLRTTNEHFTNLRPGFFAQNLETAYLRDIVEESRIFVPAGTAKVNWIDVRDIAAVAALIFLAPEAHRAVDYTLTGPGAIPWSEVTGALSESLGRTIRYEPATIAGYAHHLLRRGAPLGAVAVQTTLHTLLRFGQGATYDPTLERVLGRPGRTMRDYVRDRAAVWTQAG